MARKTWVAGCNLSVDGKSCDILVAVGEGREDDKPGMKLLGTELISVTLGIDGNVDVETAELAVRAAGQRIVQARIKPSSLMDTINRRLAT